MKISYVVDVRYNKFIFDDEEEAIAFATSALVHGEHEVITIELKKGD